MVTFWFGSDPRFGWRRLKGWVGEVVLVWGCGLGGDRAGSRWRAEVRVGVVRVHFSTATSKALSGCLLGGAERPVRTVARDLLGLRVRQEHPQPPKKLRLG